jgi:hypothetical protein
VHALDDQGVDPVEIGGKQVKQRIERGLSSVRAVIDTDCRRHQLLPGSSFAVARRRPARVAAGAGICRSARITGRRRRSGAA